MLRCRLLMVTVAIKRTETFNKSMNKINGSVFSLSRSARGMKMAQPRRQSAVWLFLKKLAARSDDIRRRFAVRAALRNPISPRRPTSRPTDRPSTLPLWVSSHIRGRGGGLEIQLRRPWNRVSSKRMRPRRTCVYANTRIASRAAIRFSRGMRDIAVGEYRCGRVFFPSSYSFHHVTGRSGLTRKQG